MILGFSGTRNKPTDAQLTWLDEQLRNQEITKLHHGACVGSDACAHRLALMYGIHVVVHPPLDTLLADDLAMDPSQENVTVLQPFAYSVRNRHIVDASHKILATPDSPYRPSSGTWHAIGYAMGRKVPVTVCYGDGFVETR